MKSICLFKTSVLIPFFLYCLLKPVCGSEQLPDTTRNIGVPFTGLTKTVTSLLKTRTLQPVLLGAYEIYPENLIDDDLAAVFDCDSVIMQYLSDAEQDATYEMLSYEMSRAIEGRLSNDDGFLYVDILSDTTGSGMFFNIAINMSRPVSVPVVFIASDSSFSASFDTTCTLEFTADIDLFVDAAMALRDSASRACSIRVNSFTVGLYSVPWDEFEYYECFDCDWDEIDYQKLTEDSGRLFPFIIDGTYYNATTNCFILYAKSFWHLSPADASSFIEDEETAHTLSFEQIEKGNYTWDESQLSALETAMVMLPADESWDSLPESENRATFQYTVDDLFDGESLEQIWLYSGFNINDQTTLRTRRYSIFR